MDSYEAARSMQHEYERIDHHLLNNEKLPRNGKFMQPPRPLVEELAADDIRDRWEVSQE